MTFFSKKCYIHKICCNNN